MKENLPKQTLESLIKQRNLMKGVATAYIILLVIAISVLLYLSFKNKNFVPLAVAPSSMIILVPILLSLGRLNKEIKSREADI